MSTAPNDDVSNAATSSSLSTQNTFFHAVGPGKQFPPRNTFRGKPDMFGVQSQERIVDENDDENDDGDVRKETEKAQSVMKLSDFGSPTPIEQVNRIEAPWKVYDAAESMINDRRRKSLLTDNFGKVASNKMIYCSQWNETNTILQLHDHISSDTFQMDIAHQTFRIAAMTVLRAIEQQQQPKTPPDIAPLPITSNTTATNEEEDDDDGANDTAWEKDLPESLRQFIHSTENDDASHAAPTSFASLRAYCMERSYENKEYTKRKGGKTEIMTRRPQKVLKVKAEKDTTQPPTPTTCAVQTPSMAAPKDTAAAVADANGNTPIIDTDSTKPSLTDINLLSATSPLSSGPNATSSPSKPRPTSTVYTTHAILRATGDLVLDHFCGGSTRNDTISSSSSLSKVVLPNNDVWTSAQELAKRTIRTVTKAFQRNHMRYQSRIRNAYFDHPVEQDNMETNMFSILYDHPFSYSQQQHVDSHDDRNDMATEDNEANGAQIIYQPNYNSITYEWQTYCRPHLLSMLQDNVIGNAIYIDAQWTTRHGRIADTLQTQRTYRPSILEHDDDDDVQYDNYGPHLIVTTENEVQQFAQEFYPWDHPTRIYGRNDTTDDDDGTELQVYALPYQGSKKQRRHLRKLFSKATGTANASFHVVITSYDNFMEDWLHFCQIPFDTVILDDGVPWLAAKEASSTLGLVWNSAIFSSNDQYNGLAGTTNKEWDYSSDDIPEAAMKDAWIGLTAKHRIATGSTLTLSTEQATDFVPVSNLLEFLTPQFFSDIKDDWDKSKAANDTITLDHFRKLLSRFISVYCDKSPLPAMSVLSENALFGALESPDRTGEHIVPTLYTWDDFIESGKALQRSVLRWLGPPQTSWIRYALGKMNFQHIMDAMKVSQYFGPLCEVITTSSSLTSAGATGQVSGVAAFRLAVRCGRHFGSDLGLRQHLLAQHAPSGTWKCRTCSIDCVTSQTRTHHEKLCGQVINVESIPIEPFSSADTALNARQVGGVKVNNGRKKQNKPGPSGRTSVANDTASNVDHGDDAENVVPALAVINIKDLPPDVKPLLRDPRQTSRTGGNSKRHIYAYRGVCRQARKGHDRWQSQISFAGVNHYLGTFDSEWDAAAIYAWAHLILYGEEATKLAQKEGEEAAAAYEQEQRDIAAGKMPEPPPKSETKKKPQIRKSKEAPQAEDEKAIVDVTDTAVTLNQNSSSNKPMDKQKTRKRKLVGIDPIPKVEAVNKGKQSTRRDSLSVGNKAQSASSKQSSTDKEVMTLFLAKSVMKAPILGPRADFFQIADSDLITAAGQRLKMARMASYSCTFPVPGETSSAEEFLRPCIPYNKNVFNTQGSKNQSTNRQVNSAILVGLSASSLQWDLQSFVEESVNELRSEQDIMAALQLLAVEYDDDGVNEKFLSLIQGTICTIGCASKLTQEMYHSLGLGSVPLGGSVGTLDCHIGGVPGSCSEISACIRYDPNESKSSRFQISCLGALDIVSVNGKSITPEMGDIPLFHNDICSVGARVFALVEPK